MINSLKLTNYKAFENQLIEFKPLTLLSGLNSTGKSSILQSLLLLRQSYQQELLPNVGLALNGELVRIGTAQDAFCERAKEDYLGFEIIWNEGKKGIWRFSYDPIKTGADVLNNLDLKLPIDNVYRSSLFNKRFHYLQAERLGPRTSYDMSDYQARRLGQLGSKGEYTAHFLAINQDKDVLQSKLRHPMAKSNALSSQVEGWMREVSPGTRIKINSNSDIGLMSLQYFYGDSNPYRTTNVGFGISYILPIIVQESWDCNRVKLEFRCLDEDGEIISEIVEIIHASRSSHVQEHASLIQQHQERIYQNVSDGLEVWNRREELFPNLEFCDAVRRQLEDIRTGQLELQSVVSILFELHKCSKNWENGYLNLDGYPIEESGESKPTLDKYFKERTFRCPDGEERLFERHVKLRFCNWRIHFFPVKPGQVIIGYVGRHLPTVKYRT